MRQTFATPTSRKASGLHERVFRSAQWRQVAGEKWDAEALRRMLSRPCQSAFFACARGGRLSMDDLALVPGCARNSGCIQLSGELFVGFHGSGDALELVCLRSLSAGRQGVTRLVLPTSATWTVQATVSAAQLGNTTLLATGLFGSCLLRSHPEAQAYSARHFRESSVSVGTCGGVSHPQETQTTARVTNAKSHHTKSR